MVRLRVAALARGWGLKDYGLGPMASRSGGRRRALGFGLFCHDHDGTRRIASSMTQINNSTSLEPYKYV
jgi:hypothetical protein